MTWFWHTEDGWQTLAWVSSGTIQSTWMQCRRYLQRKKDAKFWRCRIGFHPAPLKEKIFTKNRIKIKSNIKRKVGKAEERLWRWRYICAEVRSWPSPYVMSACTYWYEVTRSHAIGRRPSKWNGREHHLSKMPRSCFPRAYKRARDVWGIDMS